MKLLKAIATVGGLTLLSRIAGFIRDILTATVLGAGIIGDAFFVALKLPNFFRRITAEGAFSISFIPVFSEVLEKDGQEEAQAFARNMMSYMFCILTPLIVVAMLAMPWIIYGIAPGFTDDAERYDLAVELSRITFPYLLLISLTALIGGVLNSVNRYAPFAAAPVLFNLCLITALLVHSFVAPTPGHAMAWAVTLSGVVQLIWVYIFSRRAGYKLSLRLPQLSDRTKRVAKLMVPGIIGAGVMHINLFVDIILASLLPAGSISYLYYADRLAQLPLGVVGIAVGTALLPMLSRAISGARKEEAKNLFNRSFEFSLMLALPASMALMSIAFPIVSVLFERGAFQRFDSVVTAHVLTAYAAGLPAYVLAKVYSSSFFARQDTKTPVKISIIITVFNIVLSIILIGYIKILGIAVSTALAGWLQLFLLWRASRGMEHAVLEDDMKKKVGRIVFSASAMCGLLSGAVLYFKPALLGDQNILEISILSGMIIAGCVTYFGLLFLMGVLRLSDLKKLRKGT